ncbi:MAG: hypothetical protein Q8P01_00050 [bacterium]|nr:hypothetical protein [bacterium]
MVIWYRESRTIIFVRRLNRTKENYESRNLCNKGNEELSIPYIRSGKNFEDFAKLLALTHGLTIIRERSYERPAFRFLSEEEGETIATQLRTTR